MGSYGKRGVDRFVLEGYGTWPKLVFSNQAVLIGPKDDPAKIRGLSSVASALSPKP
jgi:tungstate transport system substrate-binding protein